MTIINSQDARHPAEQTFEAEVAWSVLGFESTPSYQTIAGFEDEGPFYAIVTIQNTGEETLSDIIIQVNGNFLPVVHQFEIKIKHFI